MEKNIVNKWIDKLKNIYDVEEIDNYLIDFLENLNYGCFLFINRNNNRWIGELTKDNIWYEIKELIKQEQDFNYDDDYFNYERYFMDNMENRLILGLWDDGTIINETSNFINELSNGMYD